MLNFDSLPVPDWGLVCRECGTSLAGANAHRCPRCSADFIPRDLLAMIRPVPAVDVRCSFCGYELEGLTGGVCPECGDRFNLHYLLHPLNIHYELSYTIAPYRNDAHAPENGPRFDGTERPLPDFGLRCLSCRHPLAGAAADDCPRCGRHFSIDAYRDSGDQTDIGPWIPPSLFGVAEHVLAECGIPCVVLCAASRWRGSIRGDVIWIQLLVERAWVLDALHALAAEPRSAAPPTFPWTCPACGEGVPAHFGVCWNCQSAHQPDAPPPA